MVYALGGGAGHLTRALSFARAADKRDHHTTIISNSPWATALRAHAAWPDRVELHAIAPSTPKRAVISSVTELLASEPHDALVVDTFPRGLAGELPALTSAEDRPRVWVHRDMTQEYADRPDVVRAASGYDLVLAPGERGPLADRLDAQFTAPWLSLDREELLPRDRAREILGVQTAPVALVLGSPDSKENADAAELATRLASRESLGWSVRFASLGDSPVPSELRAPRVWPLMQLYAGVDALIGAGGYNTVHEARAAGVPLLAAVRTRLYDRQSRRLNMAERVAPVEIEARLRGMQAQRDAGRSFDNGAHEAVRLTSDLLR